MYRYIRIDMPYPIFFDHRERQRRAFPAALAPPLLSAALRPGGLSGDRGLLDGAAKRWRFADGQGAAASGWA